MTSTDVLVIGAGQAGLATGHALRGAGLGTLVLDAHRRLGETWRRRPESLVLFTPRRFSALPGLGLPGDPDGYPSGREFADYLEAYAHAVALPVRLGARVAALDHDGRHFVASTGDDERIAARAVVIATGAFQVPVVPPFATRLDPAVAQFTTETFGRPDRVPPGRVLVVGDGASGRQIARELAATHRVRLAGGKRRNLVPQRILGQDLFQWLHWTGLLHAPTGSWVGRRLRERDPIPGRESIGDGPLARAGVIRVPRVVTADGRRVRTADGREIETDAVVWALGYRDDGSWIRIPGGEAPGLVQVGRPWQASRASALILGAGEEARRAVAQVRAHLAAA